MALCNALVQYEENKQQYWFQAKQTQRVRWDITPLLSQRAHAKV
ncbi:MAG: hypothetical protein ABIJ21_07060 [Nanoarchaeota archaeon]